MSINPQNFGSLQLRYLQNFRYELDGLVQSFDDKRSLIVVLKKLAEENLLPPIPLSRSLQDRVSVITRMSEEGRSLGAVHWDVKTMLLSRIEALESADPKKALKNVHAVEDSLFKNFPNEIVLRAFELIPEGERTLQVRRNLIKLFKKSRYETACLNALRDLDEELRSRVIANALSFYPKKSRFRFSGCIPAFLKTKTTPRPEELLQIVGLIPIDSLRQPLRDLFQGISDRYDREELIRTVKEIPEDQRSDVLEKAAPLFQISQHTFGRITILLAVNEIPKNQRVDVLEKAKSLNPSSTYSGFYWKELFRAITAIPAEDRPDVIEKARPFLKGKSEYFQTDILSAVSLIPPEERTDVIVKAEPLIKGRFGKYDEIAPIYVAVQEIPEDLRSDVIQKTIPLVKKAFHAEAVTMMLKAVHNMPASQRADVIEKAAVLFEDMSHGTPRIKVLEALEKIPEDQRSDVIAKATPFFENPSEGSDRANILTIVSLIPPSQRTDAVLGPITAAFRKSSRFFPEELEKIPADQRVDVLEKAMTFFFLQPLPEPLLLRLLVTISRIPSNQRANVIENARLFCVSTFSDILSIVEALGCISQDRRDDVVKKTIPLCRTDLGEPVLGQHHILQAVDLIPQEERSDVLAKAMPFLEGLSPKNSHRVTLFEALTLIPRDQREGVSRQVLPLVKGMLEGKLRACILYAVNLIPYEQRTDSLLRTIVFLFENIPVDSFPTLILQELERIPQGLRADVLEKAPLFLEGAENGLDRLHVLLMLSSVSQEIKGCWLPLSSQIAKIRPPSLRHTLAGLMLDCLCNGYDKRRFESPQFETLFSREHMSPFRLLTALLWTDEEGDEELEAMAAVLSSSRYKDSSEKKIVLTGFIALLNTLHLTTDEKKRCLGVIFPKDEIHAIETMKKSLKIKHRERKKEETAQQKERSLIGRINRSLSLMESIGNLGFFNQLERLETPEDLIRILTSIFAEVTNVSNIDNLSEKHLKTFGANRSPESLFIYAGKLKQLREEWRVPALNGLQLYVEEVLNGDFPSSRYEEESSIHLKTVFRDNQELKRIWMEEDVIKFADTSSADATAFDPKTYLVQRVLTDRHIPHEKIPYLAAYLNDSNALQEELSARIQRLTEDFEQTPENAALQEEVGLLRLQNELISLLQKPPHERHEICLTEIQPLIETALRGEEQFKRDLTDLASALASPTKKSSLSGWTVVDTDDPTDLLLCGTDVLGSCQNIHGGPMNRCLIGYLLDGKNRLAAVKNEKGEIAGRVILRILWDPEQQRPVLFKERAYFKPPENKQVSDALDQMCTAKAKKLRLPLVAQDGGQPQASPYPRPLVSLGSRAPFEYSDAGGGPTDGRFTVTGKLICDFSEPEK